MADNIFFHEILTDSHFMLQTFLLKDQMFYIISEIDRIISIYYPSQPI